MSLLDVMDLRGNPLVSKDFSLLDFMDLRGNPLCFHSMFMINILLYKCAKNTSFGHTFSIRKEKINSSLCHGKLGKFM